LIASSSELDQIAAGDRDIPSMQGWRHEVFGEDAVRLCKGEIALSAKGSEVRVVRL
jgi:ribonuclease D